MPGVSVIVPCYNERETIRLLLEAIRLQTYPIQDIEVIIADGMSQDGTRDVIQDYQREHPQLAVLIVDNPRRHIPSGLNRAIEASRGEFIIRLDAHSIPAQDYIQRCVSALRSGQCENVGGIWHIQPGNRSWISRSIALAASHPLGAGDALYRLGGGPARSVDTVPFGAFRRSLTWSIGMFDETLLTNEDYEFNVRIRQAGGKVWLDPEISSVYFARTSLTALARQYWRYGFWKAHMLRRYPKSLRWRQALPPLFSAGLLGLGVLSIWFPLARWLLAFQAGIYLIVLLLAGLKLSVQYRSFALMIGFPLAIAVMHLSWGSAFLWGLARWAIPGKDRTA